MRWNGYGKCPLAQPPTAAGHYRAAAEIPKLVSVLCFQKDLEVRKKRKI